MATPRGPGSSPPDNGPSGEDIALGSDLRAVALMSLGTVKASLGLADAECHVMEGAVLAREIGRPFLEVGCLAQSAAISRDESVPTRDRQRTSVSLNTVGAHVRRIYAKLRADEVLRSEGPALVWPIIGVP